MHLKHLKLLVCIKCHSSLKIKSSAKESPSQEQVLEGELECTKCAAIFPIRGGIPRFVPAVNYSSTFGFQWKLHKKTQYDSFTGLPISKNRLFQQTKWPTQMANDTILEVGSGSGRFTEVLLTTGATVVSLDYSEAVEANYGNNGNHPNLLIVQASIYEMPFQKASFDRVLCIGVIQHTPQVEKSFQSLVSMVKSQGHLAIDIYRWRWVNWLWPRYWVRPLTKFLPSKALYKFCHTYVNAIWPFTRWIHKLPAGRKINRFILVPDYRDIFALSDEALKEWAILDTFDNLSPRFDQPQSLETVRSWFIEQNLKNIEVHPGINGIEGRAQRP